MINYPFCFCQIIGFFLFLFSLIAFVGRRLVDEKAEEKEILNLRCLFRELILAEPNSCFRFS